MFVFGVCIDSSENFDRHCLPAIAAFGGEDATLITTTDKPVAASYNKMLEATLDMPEAEAIVLLRDDVEIADPRFRSKVAAAFARDDRLAVIGPAGDAPGGEPARAVEAVAGGCLVLRPHLAARLRFDEAAFPGADGYDVDFCLRVRQAGFSVGVEPLDVLRHGRTGGDESYRSAAAVWQARTADGLTERLLARTDGVRGTSGSDRGGASTSWADPLFEPDPDGPDEMTPPMDHLRLGHPEVLAHVPRDARRVLDVGCGAGMLGEQVKQAVDAHVTGLEPDPEAARIARARLDEVWRIDPASVRSLPCDPGTFDVMLLVGLVDRLVEPARTLSALLPYLAPRGHVILTVPNVRHWSVLLPLLVHDRWEYQAGGLVSPASVRHFTMTEAAGLLRSVGLDRFEVCAAQQVPLEDPAELEPLVSYAADHGADPDDVRTQLNSYEYVIVAGREESGGPA